MDTGRKVTKGQVSGHVSGPAGRTKPGPKPGARAGRPIVRISLVEARAKRGLSMADLAQLAQLDKSTIYTIEHGHACRPTTRRRLADALKMDMDHIAWPDADG